MTEMPILILLIVWGLSLVGVGYRGYTLGEASVLAEQKKEDDIRRETLELAQQGAADAIAKIEVKHTTVQQKFAAETVTHLVYRDCKHSPAGLRLVNEALTGTDAPPESVVRGNDAAAGRLVRGNVAEADRDRPSAPEVFAVTGDRER